MDVYIHSQGAHISCKDNLFVITKDTNTINYIPLHMVESISVFGNIQLTTQAINTCLRESIPILYFSYSGNFNGRIMPEKSVKAQVVINQCRFLENFNERLKFDRQIVKAKINNQLTILRRYDRTHKFKEIMREPNYEQKLKVMKKRIERVESISELMGIEGISSKIYFDTLRYLFMESDFSFSGRNRRPPRDPFNASLSIGYYFLINIITARISRDGLVPEIGILHSNGYNRPALACDLMEEWRQPIVDSIVIGMLLGRELLTEDFQFTDNGVYLNKTGIRKLIKKMHAKMENKCQYIHGITKKMSFYEAISYQIHSYKCMLGNQLASMYKPIVLR